jgi:hypothetical protein
MVVEWADDATGFDGHFAHAELAPCQTLDLGTKVKRIQQFNRHTFRLWNRRFVFHRILLSIKPSSNTQMILLWRKTDD